jgi:Ca-activated chloride channel family protein
MTDFAHPALLVVAALAPLAALALLLVRRRRQRVPALAVSQPRVGRSLDAAAITLALTGLAALWVAAAGPRRPAPAAPATAGLDLVLLLDVSGSMGRPTGGGESRFAEALRVAERFLDSRPADRVALVAFANRSAVVAPLTRDHATIRRLARAVTVGALGRGTALGDALAVAKGRLDGSPRGSGAIVVVSDGLSNAGALDPRTAAVALAALGIPVDTVAVGAAGASADGPDHALLRDIAVATGGHHLAAGGAAALESAFAELSRLRPSPHAGERTVAWEDRSHLPAGWAAAALLLAGSLEMAARRTWG